MLRNNIPCNVLADMYVEAYGVQFRTQLHTHRITDMTGPRAGDLQLQLKRIM